MSPDYRINWQMPAQPLGPAIQPEPQPVRDLIREFEQMTDSEPMLPEGVYEGDAPGDYIARCCVCDRWTPIFCDLVDIPPEGMDHYCGGSPSCCP